MKVNYVAALSLPEAWWMCLRDVLAVGYEYANDRGSFVGKRRKEFDLAIVQVQHPGMRPLIPDVPPGVPPPTSQEFVEDYLSYLMSSNKAEDEEYCYSEDTEVLTQRGWLLFYDLIPGMDSVATLNPLTDEIEYQVPDHHFIKEHSGSLRSIQSRFIDLLVTSNHRLYVASEGTTDFELRIFPQKGRFQFKRDASWIGNSVDTFVLPAVPYNNYRYSGWGAARSIPMQHWLAFLGIWLAEGSLRTGRSPAALITQQGAPQRKQILNMVQQVFPNAFVYDNDVIVCDKQLVHYLSHIGRHSHEKCVPEGLMMLPQEQLHILFDWMYFGDGTKNANLYSTVSRRLADQVQEIALKLGYSASIRIEAMKTGEIYRVGICKDRGLRPHVDLGKAFNVPYSGRVVCVHVPKYNILYVRRNGKPCWCGNTYGTYLEPQIDKIVKMLRTSPNTNQAYMTVGDPSTVDMQDPPCLRGIQCRVRYDALHFIVYFRSWDLWAGFPSNLAGLQLMKEHMAKEIGVADGEMECLSGGLHLYEHSWELARQVLKQKEA